MRHTVVSFILLLLCATYAAAQDVPVVQTVKHKSAVEETIEDAKKRGEIVMNTCLENCGDMATNQSVDSVDPGHATELPPPEYPLIARRAHASGQVKVQIVVDTEGKVIAASALSGHPLLQAASVAAARRARFDPMKYQGQPVMVTGVITYSFVTQ